MGRAPHQGSAGPVQWLGCTSCRPPSHLSTAQPRPCPGGSLTLHPPDCAQAPSTAGGREPHPALSTRRGCLTFVPSWPMLRPVFSWRPWGPWRLCFPRDKGSPTGRASARAVMVPEMALLAAAGGLLWVTTPWGHSRGQSVWTCFWKTSHGDTWPLHKPSACNVCFSFQGPQGGKRASAAERGEQGWAEKQLP